MADDVLDEVFEGRDRNLEDVLKRSRIVLAEAARGQRKKHAADDQHEEGHDDVVRNFLERQSCRPRPAMLKCLPKRVPEHVYGTVED